jgi:hypothetical protein
VKLPLVYIAGPITRPCPLTNCGEGMRWFDLLLESGVCIPFAPHFSCFQQMHYPRTHDEWLSYDYQILARCDAMFRLPGESVGADCEEDFCREQDIPIFHSLDALYEWCRDSFIASQFEVEA